jgi:hypothetical protein
MPLVPAWLGVRESIVGTFVCFQQTAAQDFDGALLCLHMSQRPLVDLTTEVLSQNEWTLGSGYELL